MNLPHIGGTMFGAATGAMIALLNFCHRTTTSGHLSTRKHPQDRAKLIPNNAAAARFEKCRSSIRRRLPLRLVVQPVQDWDGDNDAGPLNTTIEKPLTPAERMRLHRKCRHNGLRCMRLLLHETEIDALIRKGFLKRNAVRIGIRPSALMGIAIQAYPYLGTVAQGARDAAREALAARTLLESDLWPRTRRP